MPVSLEFQTVPTVEEVDEKFDDFGLVRVIVLLKTLPFIFVELQVADDSFHDELKNDVSFTHIFHLHIEHAACEVLAICYVVQRVSSESGFPNSIEAENGKYFTI